MKNYKLFLDDYRMPIDAWLYTEYEPYKTEHWIIVKNYDHFVGYITRTYEKHDSFPSIIGFDHDLADEHYNADINTEFKEKTGMDCAKWLVEFCIDNKIILPDWYGHSMNPAGRENIDAYLTNYRKHETNQIDDKIDEWHESNSDLELHEYLGFTLEEYNKYITV